MWEFWDSLRSKILFSISAIFLLFEKGNTDAWPYLPQTISTSQVDASSPRVAVDSTGRAIAVWIENGIVMTSQQPLNGIWISPPVAISGNGASTPMIVVDEQGTVTVLWIAQGSLQVTQQPFNGSWSVPVTLSQSTASNAQLAGDANGNVIAIWQEGAQIKSATQLAGGNWPSIPDILASANAANPAVAIGAQGTVAAVWEVSNVIYAATKTVASSWGAAQTISSGVNLSSHPQVTVDNHGNITAAWFSFQQSLGVYSGVHPQAVIYPSGGAWGSPSDIGISTGAMNPDRLEIQVQSYSPNGTALLWTNSSDNSLFNVQLSLYQNGIWQYPVTIIGASPTAYACAQAVDAGDNSYAMFMYTDPPTSQVVIGGTLTPLRAVERLFSRMWIFSPTGTNGYPSLSVNGTIATPYIGGVWESYDGNYSTIQALTYILPVLQPPAQFSVVQEAVDYGIFVQYNNLITWSPSPSRVVNGYVLMRNGELIGNFINDMIAYQYLDINRVQGETVTYSIYAVAPAGNISNTLIATLN